MGQYGIKEVIKISPKLKVIKIDKGRGLYRLEHEDSMHHREDFCISARELRAIYKKLRL